MNFTIVPGRGFAPLSVQLTAQPNADEIPESIEWDFGDGSGGEGNSVEHDFVAGVWTVSLSCQIQGVTVVVKKANCVIVSNPSNFPADFDAWPNSGSAPLTTIFSGVTKVGFVFRWDFGDGQIQDNILDNPSTSHEYNASGLFSVTLTAIDPINGLVFSFTRQNYIQIPNNGAITPSILRQDRH